ncbi:hypothetical protein V6N13_050614 [Hibiscus sabdariffa]
MYYLFDFPRRLELDYDSLVSGHEAKLVAEDSSFGLKFSGSCNGLLCVFASPRTLALVNPSTRETKTILSDHDPNITHDFTFMHPIFGGFGYDPFNDDYKVVSIDGAWWGRLHPYRSICLLVKKQCMESHRGFSSRWSDNNKNHRLQCTHEWSYVMTMAEESRKKGKERKETKEVNGHDISNIDKSKQRMKDTSLPANQMGQFDSTQVIMEGEDQPSKQE